MEQQRKYEKRTILITVLFEDYLCCSFLNWNFGEQRRYKKNKIQMENVDFYSSCHNRTKFNSNIEWWYFSRWQLSRLPRNFFDYYSFGSREQPCIRPFSIWVKNFPSGKIPIYSISGNNSNGWFFLENQSVFRVFPKWDSPPVRAAGSHKI